MRKYEEPEIDLIEFETEDVMVTISAIVDDPDLDLTSLSADSIDPMK